MKLFYFSYIVHSVLVRTTYLSCLVHDRDESPSQFCISQLLCETYMTLRYIFSECKMIILFFRRIPIALACSYYVCHTQRMIRLFVRALSTFLQPVATPCASYPPVVFGQELQFPRIVDADSRWSCQYGGTTDYDYEAFTRRNEPRWECLVETASH